MDEVTRERLGLLCGQLGWSSFRMLIASAGAEAQLDGLLVLLTGPGDPDDTLVTELLDAVEDAYARQGMSGLTARDGASSGTVLLPPGITGQRTLIGWTCPLDRCNRVVTADETPHPPTCGAHGPDGRMTPYPPTGP
ncbi:hypothetical protein ACFQ6N_04395 [Kitasatospora sp. NPDC056446]|uniref:hypothetical protein n=1 Tax=Kitasatospora sp. NPDC056446 TaxID=3345819 RepID=UPI003686AF85